MSIDRPDEIHKLIKNMNDYFYPPEGETADDNFSELVQEFDNKMADPDTITYLKHHPEEMQALAERNEKIADVYVNTFTDMINEVYKKIDLDPLAEDKINNAHTPEEIDQLAAHLDKIAANITEIANVMSSISDYVKNTIISTVSKEERDLLMERYLITAKKLYDNGNYAAAQSIIQICMSNDISRLYNTDKGTKGLSKKAIEIYEELSQVFNFANRDNEINFEKIAAQFKEKGKLPPVVKYSTKFERAAPTLEALKDEKGKLEKKLKIYKELGNANDVQFTESCEKLANSYKTSIEEHQKKIENLKTSSEEKQNSTNQIALLMKDLNTINQVIEGKMIIAEKTITDKNEILSNIITNTTDELGSVLEKLNGTIKGMGNFIRDEFDLYYKPYDEGIRDRASQSLENDIYNREDFLFLNKLNAVAAKLKPKLTSMQNKIAFLSDDVSKDAIIKLMKEHLQFIESVNNEIKSETDMHILDPYIERVKEKIDYLMEQPPDAYFKKEFNKSQGDFQLIMNAINEMNRFFSNALSEVSKQHRYPETKVRESLIHKEIPEFFSSLNALNAKQSIAKTISKSIRAARRKTQKGIKKFKTKIRKQPKDLTESETNLKNYIKTHKNDDDKVLKNRAEALEIILKKVESLESNLDKLRYLNSTIRDKKIKIKIKIKIGDGAEEGEEEKEISLKKHHVFSDKPTEETSILKLLKAYNNDIATNVVADVTNGEGNLNRLTEQMKRELSEKKIADGKVREDIVDPFILNEQRKPLPAAPLKKPLPTPALETVQHSIKEQQEYFDKQAAAAINDSVLTMIFRDMNELCEALYKAKSSEEIEAKRSQLNFIKNKLENYLKDNNKLNSNETMTYHLTALERLISHKEKALEKSFGNLHVLMIDIKTLQEKNNTPVGVPQAEGVVKQLKEIYKAMLEARTLAGITSQKDKLDQVRKSIHELYARNGAQQIDHDMKVIIQNKLVPQVIKLNTIIQDAEFYHRQHEAAHAHQQRMFTHNSHNSHDAHKATPDTPAAQNKNVMDESKSLKEKTITTTQAIGSGLKKLGEKVRDKFTRKPGGHT